MTAIALTLGVAASAIAQTVTPAAPVAAPPAWMQGISDVQTKGALHPFAPHMTGRPSSDLPLNKLKVPAGFQVEVWAEGIPEARSLALGDKGTVFVSNRNLSNVYAVVDRDGKREVKTLLKGLSAPNGLVLTKVRFTSPSVIALPVLTGLRTGWTTRLSR